MNQDSKSTKGQTVKLLPPIPIASFQFLSPILEIFYVTTNKCIYTHLSNAVPLYNTNFSILYTLFHILIFFHTKIDFEDHIRASCVFS